ncbi:MAG: hypothetical protein SF187_26130 [Deltaproteobacteria bacterium]|nr:hypothetical protein [Deltaproteobacteria bacterium]
MRRGRLAFAVSLIVALAQPAVAWSQDTGARDVVPAVPPASAVPEASVVPAAAPAADAQTPLDLTALDPNLLADPGDPRANEARLDIYGFSDFTYGGFYLPKGNRWRGYLNPHSGFGIGNLNVYFKGTLSERARSLVEIRFMYLPSAYPQVQSDGSVKYTDTKVRDPLELNRELRWGGIVIERAWVEYELHELLTVRAGQFLTPYGIWNVDHGSPTIIGIRRPFVVTEPFIPERQTGIETYGRRSFSNLVAGYHLTLSNGRGIGEEYLDRDDNKAVGGRAFVTTMAVGELTLGGSFYRARRTTTADKFTYGPSGEKLFTDRIIERSREIGLAADVKWRWRNLHVQGELLARQRNFDDNARERLSDYSVPSFTPNNFRWGAYGLVGYRTPLAGIMPFVLVERVTFPTGDLPNAMSVHLGLNYRPEASLVLKAEAMYAWFPGALQTSFGVDNLISYALQVAWVF